MTQTLFPFRWIAVLAIAVLVVAVTPAAGQGIGISSLFKPGVRVGLSTYPEAAVTDSLNVGFSTARFSAIVPLGGKVQLDWKKLDAKVSQAFLNMSAGVCQVELTGSGPRDLYRFTIGVTGVKAGLGKGIWAYTANVGLIHDYGVDQQYRPFGAAGIMRVRVKGIHKQNFFGAGIAVNRFIVPVPIWGLRRKIVKRTHLMLLLPIQADVNWKPGNKLQFSWWNRWHNFSSTLLTNPGNPLQSMVFPQHWMTYRSLQTSVVGQYKVGNKARIIVEGGLSYFRGLRFDTLNGRDELLNESVDPAPFARVAVHVNIGKSPIGSQLFGSDF